MYHAPQRAKERGDTMSTARQGASGYGRGGLLGAAMLVLGFASLSPATAQSFGAGGGFGGGFGGAGTGGATSFGITRGTAIGDGMGGFTLYGQQGTSRYISSPASPGKVYHPNGTSSLVMPDGAGNLDITGPQGGQKVFRGPSVGPASSDAFGARTANDGS